jgi:hypothetical protein
MFTSPSCDRIHEKRLDLASKEISLKPGFAWNLISYIACQEDIQ